MTKLRIALVAAVTALLALFVAGPAQAAYAPPIVSGGATTTTVAPGGTFTVSFSSTYLCTGWTATFNGTSITGPAGSTFSGSFTAPTTPGTYNGTANCTYDDGTTPVAFGGDPAILAATATASHPFSITVVAASSGVLPSTGGSNWEILALGGGALIVGAGIVFFARRKSSEA